MFNFVYSVIKRGCLLLPVAFLTLVLLCGCGTPQASLASTSNDQTVFPSYVGKWEVHDSLLTINANYTGLEQWNAGPCPTSTTQAQMCNGNANITFIENTDGSIKGAIRSVSYSEWNGGGPAPTGFQPPADDPRAGDTFQLQHSGDHLLYTTWFGRLQYLNNANRYWCDSYARNAGWQQCGA